MREAAIGFVDHLQVDGEQIVFEAFTLHPIDFVNFPLFEVDVLLDGVGNFGRCFDGVHLGGSEC